jgi:hypothetical protein
VPHQFFDRERWLQGSLFQQCADVSLGESFAIFHGVEHGLLDVADEVGMLDAPTADTFVDAFALAFLLR